MRKKTPLVIFIFFIFFQTSAQQAVRVDTVVYKVIDTVSLKMDVIYPFSIQKNKKYPCIVFFYGGGWEGRNYDQFRRQANHFAGEGFICFLADYRTKLKQGTTPFESLKDAKSAIRFIRANASKFHINKDSLIGSGGSAGGHLAAATALVDGYNESGDDLSVSCIPNALVLFNPVIDNGPGGYGFERIGEQYKSFSPLHNIRKGAPPTIIFLGTKDHLIPEETMKYYQLVMEKVGSHCDLVLYKEQDHGFFNKKEYVEKTLAETDKFLTSLGYFGKHNYSKLDSPGTIKLSD